jgi:hypothetical protein
MAVAALMALSALAGFVGVALGKLYWLGHDHATYYKDTPCRLHFVRSLVFRVERSDSVARKLGFTVFVGMLCAIYFGARWVWPRAAELSR